MTFIPIGSVGGLNGTVHVELNIDSAGSAYVVVPGLPPLPRHAAAALAALLVVAVEQLKERRP